MVQYTENELIIRINTSAPLEKLIILKKALLRIIENIQPEEVETNSGLIYDIQWVSRLLLDMEFESEQIQDFYLASLKPGFDKRHFLPEVA